MEQQKEAAREAPRLMAQWSDYLTGAGKGRVVQLAEHRA
jgi:hypothetical protein